MLIKQITSKIQVKHKIKNVKIIKTQGGDWRARLGAGLRDMGCTSGEMA